MAELPFEELSEGELDEESLAGLAELSLEVEVGLLESALAADL